MTIVIILDEPTLGIDPSEVKDFLVLIKQLSKQKGLTVLLSSHHLHHVQQVCDRVGIFVDGHLLADGSIDSLSSHLFGKNGHVTSVTLQQLITRPWAHEGTLKEWEGLKQITVEDHKIEFTCSHDMTPRFVRFLVEQGYDISEVHKKDYMDATTTLLMPSVRSLGPVTMEQMAGAIPAPLPLRESLLIVWPQVSGLLASTMVCFALSYYLFMHREIRS